MAGYGHPALRSDSVGADDSVRPNDERTIFDRADRVVGPYNVIASSAHTGVAICRGVKNTTRARKRETSPLPPLPKRQGVWYTKTILLGLWGQRPTECKLQIAASFNEKYTTQL